MKIKNIGEKILKKTIKVLDKHIFDELKKTNQKILEKFNQLIKKVCFENNIKFFDITDISREAELNSDLIAVDSLHPSGIMYKKWIDKILNE